MLIKLTPQYNPEHEIKYTFGQDLFVAEMDGVTDVFDFTAVRSAVKVSTIRTSLEINPIEKVEYDGTLKITITNFIGPDASEDERYPNFEEV